MGEDCGSILISIPAARSCAAILSRSRTRKFSIQTFWASPKYLLVSGKGAKAVGPASCSQTESPSLDGMSEIPKCCWYQSPNAFGSLARKKNPPTPVTFSISVAPATASRTAGAAGRGEVFGGTAVCAAMAGWFRPKMFDPKANDRVRNSWRLRKGIPSSSEKSVARGTISAQTGSGKRKDEVLGDLSAIRKLSFYRWTRWIGPGKSCGLNRDRACRAIDEGARGMLPIQRCEN